MVGVEENGVPLNICQFVELVHPLDRARVEQAIKSHLQHGKPYKNIEMRVKGADGSFGHFLANGAALRDQKGNSILLVGSLTDQTPMQKVEQNSKIRKSAFRLCFI